ncbi:hypothetical protein STRIP9103_04047, partial [Streptomyces ipomoeae 91-03]
RRADTPARPRPTTHPQAHPRPTAGGTPHLATGRRTGTAPTHPPHPGE